MWLFVGAGLEACLHKPMLTTSLCPSSGVQRTYVCKIPWAQPRSHPWCLPHELNYPPSPLAPSFSFVFHSIRRLIWLRCHAGACRGDAKDMLEASSSSAESVSELKSCMSADGELHLHASLASSAMGCPWVRAEQSVPEPSELCPLSRASASACRTAGHAHYKLQWLVH